MASDELLRAPAVAETPAHPIRSRSSRTLSLAARLAAIACLLAAGWHTAAMFAAVFAGTRPVPSRTDTPGSKRSPAPAELLELLPADGAWRLAGSSHEWAVTRVQASALADILTRATAGVPPAGPPSPDEAALLDLAHLLPRAAPGVGVGARYRLDHDTLKVEVITKYSGSHERLAALRIALAAGRGQWNVYDVGATAQAGPSRAGARLLPLPPGAAALAARYDRGGHLLAEVVSVAGGLPDLVANWRSAGWTIEQQSSAGLSLSQEHGTPSTTVLCRRGDDVVLAWVFPCGAADARLGLVLVRAPGLPSSHVPNEVLTR
jgi:hypothetical protein